MSKKSLVDSIEIKSPCAEDWGAMSGNEKVRFCSHCSKNVNDLSQMTRKRAMRLVRDSGGNLCVRYVKNPVSNQPVFAEKLYQITRRAGLAAGVLGASLAFSTLTYAQGSPHLKAENDNTTQTLNKNENIKTESPTASVSGTITDSNGAIIPNAIVTLTNDSTKSVLTVSANDEGFYEFKEVFAGTYTLKITAMGFREKYLPRITVGESQILTKDVSLDVGQVLMGFIAFSTDKIYPLESEYPLHQAIDNEDFEEAESLILKGANVNQKDKSFDNITPLFIAVANGDVKLAEILLRFGAKVNARDDNKRTPMMRLDSDANIELVRLLMRYGARVNAVDKQGNTPLILASETVGTDVLQVLLTEGANPNAQNKVGRTALMNAAENDNLENVRALILAGADVNLKNKEGDSAWNLTSDVEIEKLLESYGATTDDN